MDVGGPNLSMDAECMSPCAETTVRGNEVSSITFSFDLPSTAEGRRKRGDAPEMKTQGKAACV